MAVTGSKRRLQEGRHVGYLRLRPSSHPSFAERAETPLWWLSVAAIHSADFVVSRELVFSQLCCSEAWCHWAQATAWAGLPLWGSCPSSLQRPPTALARGPCLQLQGQHPCPLGPHFCCHHLSPCLPASLIHLQGRCDHFGSTSMKQAPLPVVRSAHEQPRFRLQQELHGHGAQHSPRFWGFGPKCL